MTMTEIIERVSRPITENEFGSIRGGCTSSRVRRGTDEEIDLVINGRTYSSHAGEFSQDYLHRGNTQFALMSMQRSEHDDKPRDWFVCVINMQPDDEPYDPSVHRATDIFPLTAAEAVQFVRRAMGSETITAKG